ncbi:NAD(P)-dependent alcohol dehydrogenase [Myxococcus sp. CA056]|uniref:zinc-dependent alcohol dehydrogenase family protein n=2 Tax=Myxococcus TaxID=32 RepID=UPI00157AFDD6|nr:MULTISPECIES: NAD(P)-dependent alcohol dehydrogenase [unclassified Myxococcus]NTX09845.1 NAD(P)-dependent alcohol dehydrogenase [Myxococcus sp. CA056]NTX35207.1 NAD(P)-dependent alcohol dehydrogenase [Myxococcus sp. CA033]NTX51212.1 NAD(P)-dependent alcohol dehydrogenase [Myxococcus sp. CA039A]
MDGVMKRWELRRPGRANLELASVAIPTPVAGEVLVRVSAVSLNYREKLFLDGAGYSDVPWPFVPTSDMVGEVVATGGGVTRFKVGERVLAAFNADWVDGPVPRVNGSVRSLGGSLPGVLSEYVAMPESWLVAAPRTLDDVRASTLPCAGLTAWTALVELGGVRPGQTVVTQGTGGVSLFAVQLASALGARVIVTSGDEEKLARAKKLGAAHGIHRRQTPDWEKAVVELTGGRGADHILEMVGGDNLARSVSALAPGGRVTLIGVLDGFDMRFPVVPLFQTQGVIQGVLVGNRRGLENFVRAVDALRLEPVVDATYALREFPKALEHLDRGPFGKVVVRVRE